jgi:apolipoprotein D and lipocalin family protein
MKRALVIGLLGLCALGTSRAADPPLATVPDVDLNRYAGIWHQVALLPNRFQAHCVGDTTAEYALVPGGRLRVTNRCRLADGRFDEVVGEARQNAAYARPAILEVSFVPRWLRVLPFVWGDYWILALEPDYGAVMVGAPDRKYLWILAREPQLAHEVYNRYVALARAAGFPVEKLVRE